MSDHLGGRKSPLFLGIVCLIGWLNPSNALSQDELEDDPDERRDRIIAMIEAAMSESKSRPSVLAGYDPRYASRHEKKVARILRLQKISVSIEGEKIPDVIDLLRKLSGLTIVTSREAKEWIQGNDPDVNLNLNRISLEGFCNLFCLRHPQLRFQIRYGALMLVTRKEYRPKRVLRVYNIRDLVRPRRDFPAPPLGLDDIERDTF